VFEPLPMPPPLPAPPAPTYAGFWIRVLAFLIDGLVLAAVEAPLWIPFVWAPLWRSVQEGMRTGVPQHFRPFYGWTLLGAVLSYLYAFVMVGRWNATLGKFAVGIRVCRSDGAPAGWREAALRPILQTVLMLPRLSGVGLLTLVDDLWMVWDRQNQTLHDKIAGTIVVKVSTTGPLQDPR
jgi:uncharacterized RDD family membrane protein YckC